MTRRPLLQLLIALSTIAAPILACSSSSTGSGSSSGSSSGVSSSGGTTCTPNTTDGSSACPNGPMPKCMGNDYCSVLTCKTGCLSTANCASGLFCDMSAATKDLSLNVDVGICRACTTTKPTGCDDVHGAYTLHANSSSSARCPSPMGECAVTQTACMVTLACPGSTGTNTATIDATDKGSFNASFTQQGQSVTATCAVSFTSASMLLDCQFTSSQGAAACKIDGTKK